MILLYLKIIIYQIETSHKHFLNYSIIKIKTNADLKKFEIINSEEK